MGAVHGWDRRRVEPAVKQAEAGLWQAFGLMEEATVQKGPGQLNSDN